MGKLTIVHFRRLPILDYICEAKKKQQHTVDFFPHFGNSLFFASIRLML